MQHRKEETFAAIEVELMEGFLNVEEESMVKAQELLGREEASEVMAGMEAEVVGSMREEESK